MPAVKQVRAPRAPGWSLRRRIVSMILAAVAVTWMVLAALMYQTVRVSSAGEFDERLRRQARVVLGYAEHEYRETGGIIPEAEADTQAAALHEAVYQVWTQKKTLLYRSPRAPLTALVPIEQTGFSDVTHADRAWRAFVQTSRNLPIVVEIAEPASQRNLIAGRVMRSLLAPVAIALGLMAAMVWLVGDRALRPLHRFAENIRHRAPEDLTPIPVDAMPVETAGLGAALNDLLQRQALALERERRFTADAAHELRTPLAAMRAQAQVAARASSWPEAKAAQHKLIAGVDRATRLVSQLLTLARLEPGASLGSLEIVRVDDVVAEVVEDLQAAASSGQIEITVHSVPVRVGGHTDAIYVMLRNLVENAVQHTPAGANVEILCGIVAGIAELQVTDRGPGVPPEERSKIFDRFYRLPGEPADGSGLGLSIVRRVAELHHASIDLHSGAGGIGLSVRVRFPPEPI